MKKESILVGALILGAFTVTAKPVFTTLNTIPSTISTGISDAACGDKTAEAKVTDAKCGEGKCGDKTVEVKAKDAKCGAEGKCGEAKCGDKAEKKSEKKAAKKAKKAVK